MFWAEGQVSVGVVKVLGILEVHLENVAFVMVVGNFPEGLLRVFDPAEASVW